MRRALPGRFLAANLAEYVAGFWDASSRWGCNFIGVRSGELRQTAGCGRGVQIPPSPYKRHPLTAEQQAEIQQAFNVIALKSSLMVGALACNQQSQYDVFMTDFQPHILAEQHVMDAYFRRIGGYYGQAREDDFVTLMANNQSVTGIGEGAVFCLNNQAEFNQVLQFKSPSDLDNFVTDQSPTSMIAQTSPVSSIVPPTKKAIKLADSQAN